MTALSRYLLMLGTAMEYKKAALGKEMYWIVKKLEVLFEIFTTSRPIRIYLAWI